MINKISHYSSTDNEAQANMRYAIVAIGTLTPIKNCGIATTIISISATTRAGDDIGNTTSSTTSISCRAISNLQIVRAESRSVTRTLK